MTLSERERARVRVGVRLRPTAPHDIQERSHEAVFLDVADPQALNVVVASPYGRRISRELRFDVCLDRDATQEDVMHGFGIYQLLNAVLSGESVCIMAYGTTGAGKTHTMTGSPGDRSSDGVTQRAARYVFEALPQDDAASVYVSYVEIYNEAVYDLLGSRETRLSVKGFEVVSAKAVCCRGLEAVCEVSSPSDSEDGSEPQAQPKIKSQPHDLDGRDGKSRCFLKGAIRAAQEAGGKLMLVDLAGSERVRNAQRQRHETATINKSLFCLGKALAALSERSSDPSVYVPYRDSVLTKLLKAGLEPPALTLMITCCSPGDTHVEETLNTLFYAQKAMGILRGVPTVEQVAAKPEVAALREEVQELRLRNCELQIQLQAQRRAPPLIPNLLERLSLNVVPPLPLSQEDEFNNAAWEMPWDGSDALSTQLRAEGRGSVSDEIEILKTKLRALETKFHRSSERPDDQGVILVNSKWGRL